jgi:thymidine kinase
MAELVNDETVENNTEIVDSIIKGSSESSVKHGVLYTIAGPMYAGKTTKLIRLCEIFRAKGVAFEVYKNPIDVRDGRADTICSHNNETELCKAADDLCDFLKTESYKNAQIIIVEEIQFFDERIMMFLSQAVDIDKKYVIAAGLSADHNRLPFGSMSNIMAMSDKVDYLTAYCHFCEAINAPFTVKISGTENTIEVGSDMYKPCCRKHYNEYHVKFYEDKKDEIK